MQKPSIARKYRGGVSTSKSGQGFMPICHYGELGILRDLFRSIYKSIQGKRSRNKCAMTNFGASQQPYVIAEGEACPRSMDCFANARNDEKKRFFGFHPQNDIAKKAAFTLAEVLMTLGIIGIVAAMTLPSLIQKQQDKITVTKLKKMYSVFSQAYLFSLEEYGTPDNWGFGNRDAGMADEDDTDYIAQNALIIKNIFFKQVKSIKICDKALDKTNCGLADKYYYEGGSEATALFSQITSFSIIDGSSVLILVNNGDCKEVRGTDKYLKNVCAWIFVDLNNSNPPNTIGRDLFGFYLTKYGIVPEGTLSETMYNIESTNGHGKAAWIIYNENLDYLKCPGKLSWSGKKTCR